MISAASVYLQFGLVKFWHIYDIGAKGAHKMLMKLVHGLCVLKEISALPFDLFQYKKRFDMLKIYEETGVVMEPV